MRDTPASRALVHVADLVPATPYKSTLKISKGQMHPGASRIGPPDIKPLYDMELPSHPKHGKSICHASPSHHSGWRPSPARRAALVLFV